MFTFFIKIFNLNKGSIKICIIQLFYDVIFICSQNVYLSTSINAIVYSISRSNLFICLANYNKYQLSLNTISHGVNN